MARVLTPGRPSGRAGVLLSLLLLLVFLAACDVLGGGATIELEDGEVRLPGGAEVHDVTIGGAGGRDSLAPAELTAEPGDAVRFVVTDHRTHALAFEVDALDAAGREFLDRTAQLRGPPLVNEGAAWVVSLAEAPPGRYPFLCRSHQQRGVLTVTSGD